MKKILQYAALTLAICFSVTACHTSENTNGIPALHERTKAVGTGEEKETIKTVYKEATEALQKNPDDLQQYIKLATVFISEGRITGDNTYYSNAALKMLNKVTERNTGNKDLQFQALSLKSAVLLNMHQFKEALSVAQQGVALNNYNSGIYGALVDANVEMGHYDEAVKDCDKMISIRPDLRSYSRASYLRQIYGQNQGAKDAMKMAVEAGMPGAENTEWARTTLADLYLNTGSPDSAAMIYKTSLAYRPNYPFALIGLARVEIARKNYDSAEAYTQQAIQVLSEAPFVSLLADIYELKGDEAKAGDTRRQIVKLLENGVKEETDKNLVRHNANRELAVAYMNAGDMDKALQYANADLGMRPDNIDANELTAWIYYMKGDYNNAKIHADKMLATNTQNPATRYKAGAIAAASGDMQRGTQIMRDALVANPYIDAKIIKHTKPQMAVASKL